jgi:hypothetical protein
MKPWMVAGLVLLMACRETTRSTPPPTTTTAAPSSATVDPPPACVPSERRLCPVDEAPRDESFVAFRNELLDAVRQNDEARLLRHVDPNIRTSFGGGGGTEDFKQQWRSADLEKLLRLGGTFREGMFWAPYLYSAWPENVDAFQHVAAVRAGVPIRKSEAMDAETVTTVDWAILQLVPNADPRGPSVHVKTPDGQEGWVSAIDVHSPIGYRAGFSKRSGQWKLEALVAGD